MIDRFCNLSLRFRLYFLLGALLAITAGGGISAHLYAARMQRLLNEVIDRDVAALRAVKELEISLVNQRGLVTYFFLDGDPAWLSELSRHQESFRQWLREAGAHTAAGKAKELLGRIERGYAHYTAERDHVIALYRAGERDRGASAHWDVRDEFLHVHGLTQKLMLAYEQDIARDRGASLARAKNLTSLNLFLVVSTVIVGIVLTAFFVSQIINPIQRLARTAALPEAGDDAADEVTTLSRKVRGLVEDRDHTRHELERSRERLVVSEKMAVVGKLASEVAHSIRNPLTSIKMRLFALERSLGLAPSQKEDFEVVSEEIRRLDNIVSNFLEFSRPPKLKKQKASVADIVAMSVQLLQSRLLRDGIALRHLRRTEALPPVEADPELLKEVLINLIVNACEAMSEGGTLTITEDEGVAEHVGRAVLVRIADTGPGIPASIQAKVMEPFFSTKDEGTGLGLSIASRIIREHGGRLEMRSADRQGTTFIVVLPALEDEVCTQSSSLTTMPS